jgi:ribonuclease HI
VQRLINIKIAKAHKTVSNDALCIITELYKIIRGNRHKNLQTDHDKLPKQRLHPAARIIATDDPTPINIYTNGSKSEQGVGAGIAIKQPGTPIVKLMYRMGTRCSNNQAEAFAILRALEYIQTTQTKEEDKTVKVYTGSMTTLDSLINTDIRTFLTEEIRQTVHELEIRKWKIRFRWVKAHAGTSEERISRQIGERSIT